MIGVPGCPTPPGLQHGRGSLAMGRRTRSQTCCPIGGVEREDLILVGRGEDEIGSPPTRRGTAVCANVCPDPVGARECRVGWSEEAAVFVKRDVDVQAVARGVVVMLEHAASRRATPPAVPAWHQSLPARPLPPVPPAARFPPHRPPLSARKRHLEPPTRPCRPFRPGPLRSGSRAQARSSGTNTITLSATPHDRPRSSHTREGDAISRPNRDAAPPTPTAAAIAPASHSPAASTPPTGPATAQLDGDRGRQRAARAARRPSGKARARQCRAPSGVTSTSVTSARLLEVPALDQHGAATMPRDQEPRRRLRPRGGRHQDARHLAGLARVGRHQRRPPEQRHQLGRLAVPQRAAA